MKKKFKFTEPIKPINFSGCISGGNFDTGGNPMQGPIGTVGGDRMTRTGIDLIQQAIDDRKLKTRIAYRPIKNVKR
jgi:hypothetical protein